MDDLDPILVLKHGRAPVVAAHDREVQLDRNPSRRQIKLRDEFGEGRGFGEFSRFAVDVDPQKLLTTSFRRVDDTAQFGRLVLRYCAHKDRGAARSKLRNLRLNRGHTVALSL